MTGDQKAIEDLLADRIGLDPVSMGPHVILVAARRRMADLNLADLAEYAARAAASEAEQQALIEEVVVPESWFFRDDRPFRWLADRARELWVAQLAQRRAPLRALSIACAGGQEPYSIAITLLDAGLRAERFRIDAVDVSARSLEVARWGLYSANAFRGVADRDPSAGPRPVPAAGSPLQDRWAQHFRPHARGYEIDPAIRATVRFLQGNALDPSLLADEPPYDVVFCRNLLIYLDRPARARVRATLDRLLADDGVLLIGHADRLNEIPGASRFTPIGEPGCFAYAKAGRPAQPGDFRPDPFRMLPQPEPLMMLPMPAAAAVPVREPEPPPALPERTPAPADAPSPSSVPLDEAAELANRGRYEEAIAACQRHLRLHGHGASAYYLMGMIRQAAGDRRRAEECFHKAIYLDPRHDEALLALALLAERRGDHAAATGFRRRAHRAGQSPSAGRG